MLNLLLDGSTETTTKNQGGSWWIYLILLGLVVLMLVLPTITNRKRMKEYDQMVNALHVGDTVRTVGGVIGRITKISEKDGVKTFILETGAKNNKTTMEFDIGSVGTVLKSTAKPEEKAQKEEKKEEPKAEEVKAGEKADETLEAPESPEAPEAEEAKNAEKVEEAKPEKPAKKAKSKKK